jgi:hypothetical protein
MFVTKRSFRPDPGGLLESAQWSLDPWRQGYTPDGTNLVSHAGPAPLAELADRSGLTEVMSEAMAECVICWHTHDPGVVPTYLGVRHGGRRVLLSR